MKSTERGEDVRGSADTRLLVLLVIRWGVGWGFVLQKRRRKKKQYPQIITQVNIFFALMQLY